MKSREKRRRRQLRKARQAHRRVWRAYLCKMDTLIAQWQAFYDALPPEEAEAGRSL